MWKRTFFFTSKELFPSWITKIGKNESRESLKPMNGLLSSFLKKMEIKKTIDNSYSEKWKLIE